MKRLILISLSALAVVACQSEKPVTRGQTPTFYVSMAKAGAEVDAAMARDMISAYRGNNGLRPLALPQTSPPAITPWPRPFPAGARARRTTGCCSTLKQSG
ncbi:MAG: hypothetical protein K0Q60_4325 [Microvirga sp.]|nr:hypothetical protein [Microvirga sp.]